MRGENFFINDERTGKPIRLQAVEAMAFSYYYKLWEDWHYFQTLPHGRGTMSERRWLLEFLKAFDRVYRDVENFIQIREMKKPHGKHFADN